MATILLAEDNDDLRRTMVMFLEDDFEVIAASDGREALSIYQERPGNIDLIITDYNMPNMNGAQLIKLLKRNGATVPTIFCSNDDRVEEFAQECGADDWFYKEDGSDKLLDKINTLLAES